MRLGAHADWFAVSASQDGAPTSEAVQFDPTHHHFTEQAYTFEEVLLLRQLPPAVNISPPAVSPGQTTLPRKSAVVMVLPSNVNLHGIQTESVASAVPLKLAYSDELT